jgi:hypothetical protein
MGEWLDFDRWPDCHELAKPGYVFEVSNEAGQTLLTECTVPLELPWDWRDPPTRFRLVLPPAPRHSAPLPEPRKG